MLKPFEACTKEHEGFYLEHSVMQLIAFTLLPLCLNLQSFILILGQYKGMRGRSLSDMMHSRYIEHGLVRERDAALQISFKSS